MSHVRILRAAMFSGLLLLVSALLPVLLFATEPLVVTILIEGIEGELLQNARAYIRLAEAKDKPEFTVQLLRSLHNAAAGEISEALQLAGETVYRVGRVVAQTEYGQQVDYIRS